MREWIHSLESRFVLFLDTVRWRLRPEDDSSEASEGMQMIWQREWEDERVRVTRYTKRCGHEGHLIELDYYFPRDSAWHTVAIIGGESLESSTMMLSDALQFLQGRVEQRENA